MEDMNSGNIKKRKSSESKVEDVVDLTASSSTAPTTTTSTQPPKKKKVVVQPHVLIWVCHHGPNMQGKWNGNNLKVIGVYATKEAAVAKKHQMIDQHGNGGYGDLLVGDSWSDEIDLEIRKAGECDFLL